MSWPWDWVSNWVSSKASSALSSVFDAAMKEVWNFATGLFTQAFSEMDYLSKPNLDLWSGPLAGVWPVTMWISIVLAFGLSLYQIG